MRDTDVPLKTRALVYQRSGGRCEGPAVRLKIDDDTYKAQFGPYQCYALGNDVAHIKPRWKGGDDIHDPSNLLYLCRKHHREFDGVDVPSNKEWQTTQPLLEQPEAQAQSVNK